MFEAENNVLNLSATDLEISVKAKTTVAVKKEGKITLPAKKLLEIASKLPDKPVEFSLNEDNNVVSITCGNSKFEIIGISAQEFPKIEDEDFVTKAAKAGVITVPGAAFGSNGKGHVRMSYANSYENIERAMDILKDLDY